MHGWVGVHHAWAFHAWPKHHGWVHIMHGSSTVDGCTSCVAQAPWMVFSSTLNQCVLSFLELIYSNQNSPEWHYAGPMCVRQRFTTLHSRSPTWQSSFKLIFLAAVWCHERRVACNATNDVWHAMPRTTCGHRIDDAHCSKQLYYFHIWFSVTWQRDPLHCPEIIESGFSVTYRRSGLYIQRCGSVAMHAWLTLEIPREILINVKTQFDTPIDTFANISYIKTEIFNCHVCSTHF